MNKKSSSSLSNIPSEKNLLGLVLMGDQVALTSINYYMKEEYFVDEKHKAIFRAIKKLSNHKPVEVMEKKGNNKTYANVRVNSNTVINVMENDGTLEQAGGSEYINKLVLVAGDPSQINFYMKAIVESYEKNELQKTVVDSLNHINNSESTIDHVIGDLSHRISTFRTKDSQSDFEQSKDSVVNVLASLFKGGSKTKALKTYLIEVDKKMNGMNPGDLVILAARPSVGKSAFAVNLMKDMAIKGKKVAFFSLEMPREQIIYRLLANQCSVELSQFRNPEQISSDDKQKLNWTINDKLWENIWIDDTSGLGITDLVWKAKKLHNNVKLDVIIIDYLQYISYDVKDIKGKDRHLEVSHISKTLKTLARELGIPVIALAQLSRKAEEAGSKVPLLSHLRESGSIEQDADIIMFLSRESYQNHGEVSSEEVPQNTENRSTNQFKTYVTIAKNRNGETGIAEVVFEPRFSSFISYEIKGFGDK